ncbi:Short-chain dehydrogenase [Paramixta manurensis]|uniref:Short-chain dehydrogenase n=1 Tax=Paramixta manurensis TaxID=2740817 RepID=A0A6M8UCL2_9GAMM|nr:Short-chain dehydrogenase [Erwiniaceae bacterium PD-1]
MDNKIVLITGAGSGFGKESAFLLARQGYEVIATTETVAQIQSLKDEAKKEGLDIRVEKLNITDENDRLLAAEWDIDILLNNAGISEGGAVVDLPEDKLRSQFEVNVFGTILLTQHIVRRFIEKKRGKIVFVSSVAGITTDPFTGAYSASKHALEAFAEALNKEVHEFGVQVATVNPGPILTGFNDRMFEAWKHWWVEDKYHTVFDYEKISFPHEQYHPRQVSELIVKVVTGEVDTYRNVVPAEIIADTKKQMDEVWNRKVHQQAERDPLVQKSYEIAPETPNGK